MTSRALSEADGHAYTAIAYGAYQPTEPALTAARHSLGDAFAIEPTHFRARQFEVVLARDDGHMLRLAQALVKAHPREWRAWLALALIQELAEGSPKWHRRARGEALLHLSRLQPDHPRALAFGVVDALDPQDTAHALRLSARALRMAPNDALTRIARAHALAANHEEADACAILQQLHEGLAERRGAARVARGSLEAVCARLRQWTDAVLAPPP